MQAGGIRKQHFGLPKEVTAFVTIEISNAAKAKLDVAKSKSGKTKAEIIENRFFIGGMLWGDLYIIPDGLSIKVANWGALGRTCYQAVITQLLLLH